MVLRCAPGRGWLLGKIARFAQQNELLPGRKSGLILIAPGMRGLILAATLAAFVGSFVGTRLIRKITLHTIQIIVGVMLIAVGVGMASGLF